MAYDDGAVGRAAFVAEYSRADDRPDRPPSSSVGSPNADRRAHSSTAHRAERQPRQVDPVSPLENRLAEALRLNEKLDMLLSSQEKGGGGSRRHVHIDDGADTLTHESGGYRDGGYRDGGYRDGHCSMASPIKFVDRETSQTVTVHRDVTRILDRQSLREMMSEIAEDVDMGRKQRQLDGRRDGRHESERRRTPGESRLESRTRGGADSGRVVGSRPRRPTDPRRPATADERRASAHRRRDEARRARQAEEPHSAGAMAWAASQSPEHGTQTSPRGRSWSRQQSWHAPSPHADPSRHSPTDGNPLMGGEFDEAARAASFQEALRAFREASPEPTWQTQTSPRPTDGALRPPPVSVPSPPDQTRAEMRREITRDAARIDAAAYDLLVDKERRDRRREYLEGGLGLRPGGAASLQANLPPSGECSRSLADIYTEMATEDDAADPALRPPTRTQPRGLPRDEPPPEPFGTPRLRPRIRVRARRDPREAEEDDELWA